MVLEELIQVSWEFIDVEVFFLCIGSPISTKNSLVSGIDALNSFVNN